MRRLAIALALLASVPAAVRAAERYRPGEVVVLLPSESQAMRSAPSGLAGGRLGDVLRRHEIREVTRIDRIGASDRATRPQVWALRSEDPSFDPRAVASELRASGEVLAACPNYEAEWHATIPNDPFLYLQWHVNDGGDADIDLPEAWDIERGDTSVVIGICDTGVDIGHPDLQARIAVNWNEIPGNSLDDDGNGYIDDVRGWDFGVGDNDPHPQPTFDSNGIDVAFHGTFVAACATATTDNATGIAGAGWNCRILPLKLGDATGETTLAIIAEAVTYAIDNGASILNTSFGVKEDGASDFFQVLVDDATAAGVLWVASAGNDTSDVIPPPAGIGDVLSVGAIDATRARAYFSNYGPGVDLCAPGQGIWSAICRNYTLDPYTQLIYAFAFGWNGTDPYMYGSGTSSAAPITAGVAGLVRAHWPAFTPQQVILQLQQTGEVISTDFPIGPLVNAFNAVNGTVVSAPAPDLAGLSLEAPAPNPFRDGTTVGFTLPAASRVRIAVYDAAGRRVRDLLDQDLPAGSHAAHWDGRTEGGRLAAGGVYFLQLATPGAERTRRVALLPR